MDNVAVEPGIYRHYLGDLYVLHGLLVYSGDSEKMDGHYLVAYQKSGENMLFQEWRRFCDTIEIDGKNVRRFEYVGPVRAEAKLPENRITHCLEDVFSPRSTMSLQRILAMFGTEENRRIAASLMNLAEDNESVEPHPKTLVELQAKIVEQEAEIRELIDEADYASNDSSSSEARSDGVEAENSRLKEINRRLETEVSERNGEIWKLAELVRSLQFADAIREE